MTRVLISIFVASLGLAGNIQAQSLIKCDLFELAQIAFEKSPLIARSALTVESAEGNYGIQRSAFDYLLTSNVSWNRDRANLYPSDPRFGFVNGTLRSQNAGYSLGLQKQFRSGIRANISTEYLLTSDNLPFDRFNREVSRLVGDHTVSSTFSLTQPLLRGRGRQIVTANERSAVLNLQGAKDNNGFANSRVIFQVAVAYWQYLSAFKALEIYHRNEQRVRNLLSVTQQLVEADKKPVGDFAQIQADLANQERQTAIAEQNLYNAKANLALEIGLSQEEIQRLGPPQDEFPGIEESGYDFEISIDRFLTLAKENRGDLMANQKAHEALELQYQLAKNNRNPQLDLTGFVQHGGNNFGNGLNTALSTYSNSDGRNMMFGFSLNFAFPVNNNFAKGGLKQSFAALQDQEIINDNLNRTIDLSISIAFNNLKNSIDVLQKAKESLEYYQQVFENENTRFQNGLTTLLNLIIFQERLTFSELEYIQASQQFANAIINLRFETGTLISEDESKENFTLERDAYYKVPRN